MGLTPQDKRIKDAARRRKIAALEASGTGKDLKKAARLQRKQAGLDGAKRPKRTSQRGGMAAIKRTARAKRMDGACNHLCKLIFTGLRKLPPVEAELCRDQFTAIPWNDTERLIALWSNVKQRLAVIDRFVQDAVTA